MFCIELRCEIWIEKPEHLIIAITFYFVEQGTETQSD